MGRTSRTAAALAISLLLVAPLACGDDDGTSPGDTAPQATPTTGSPGDDTTTTTEPATTTTEAVTTTTESTGTVIEVTVVDKRVEGGGRKQVRKDEPVTLRVTSDVADELHVHGYDLTLDLEAGVAGELTFTPNAAGIYEVELESSHLHLLELEVR